MLRGRYLSSEETYQILRPIDVIRDLTATIFRVEGILNGVFGLLAFATLLLVMLVMMLSLRLRQREMQTMFKLGCGRSMIVGLVTAEMAIIVLVSVCLTVVLNSLVLADGGGLKFRNRPPWDRDCLGYVRHHRSPPGLERGAA